MLIKKESLIKSLLVEKILKNCFSHKDAQKIRLLCVFLQKMSAFKRDFDKGKYMSCLTNEVKLLEKHNEILKKVRNIKI